MAKARKRGNPDGGAAVTVTVRWVNGGLTSGAPVWNVSLGGVFIEMAEPLRFGAEVGLEFSLPTEPRSMRCDGVVIWSTNRFPDRAPGKCGVAVRLMDITIADMRYLSSFVGRVL